MPPRTNRQIRNYDKMPSDVSQNLIDLVRKQVQEYCRGKGKDFQYKILHEKITLMTVKLVKIFENSHLASNLDLPVDRTINIASLGCGEAIEYFALKIYFDSVFGVNNYRLNYVGVDISETTIKNAREFWDSKDIKFIHSDAADKKILKANLVRNQLLPKDGFNLVLLRQPDITSTEFRQSFRAMINEVTPYIAAENAKFLVTSFSKKEMESVKRCIDLESDSSPYTQATRLAVTHHPQGVGFNTFIAETNLPNDNEFVLGNYEYYKKELESAWMVNRKFEGDSLRYSFYGRTMVYKKSRYDAYALFCGCQGQAFNDSKIIEHQIITPAKDEILEEELIKDLTAYTARIESNWIMLKGIDFGFGFWFLVF